MQSPQLKDFFITCSAPRSFSGGLARSLNRRTLTFGWGQSHHTTPIEVNCLIFFVSCRRIVSFDITELVFIVDDFYWLATITMCLSCHMRPFFSRFYQLYI